MFHKPPRPEPPRRAIPTQVVQQREIRRVPDTLVVDHSASTPPCPPAPAAPPPVPPAEK